MIYISPLLKVNCEKDCRAKNPTEDVAIKPSKAEAKRGERMACMTEGGDAEWQAAPVQRDVEAMEG